MSDYHKFSKQSFSGQNFLITRSKEDNEGLACILESLSAKVSCFSSFSYRTSSLSDEIKAELLSLNCFDWVIFSSVRAVDAFASLAILVGLDLNRMLGIKIAVVGSKTADRVRYYGMSVDLIPKDHNMMGLAADDVFKTAERLKVYMPQAQDARQDFLEAHKNRHDVTASVFYSKESIVLPAGSLASLKKISFDWILFFSPSAFDGFMTGYGADVGLELLSQSQVAVIGKTTADHIQAQNVKVDVIANQATTFSLIESVLNHLK